MFRRRSHETPPDTATAIDTEQQFLIDNSIEVLYRLPNFAMHDPNSCVATAARITQWLLNSEVVAPSIIDTQLQRAEGQPIYLESAIKRFLQHGYEVKLVQKLSPDERLEIYEEEFTKHLKAMRPKDRRELWGGIGFRSQLKRAKQQWLQAAAEYQELTKYPGLESRVRPLGSGAIREVLEEGCVVIAGVEYTSGYTHAVVVDEVIISNRRSTTHKLRPDRADVRIKTYDPGPDGTDVLSVPEHVYWADGEMKVIHLIGIKK